MRKAVREALPAARMDCIGAGISVSPQDLDGTVELFAASWSSRQEGGGRRVGGM